MSRKVRIIALMAATEGDHEDVIDFFLKSGANVNPRASALKTDSQLGGSTPLITATRKENLSVVKKLLKRGADVNRPDSNNGWTPLKSAAHQGNFEIVKALLEAGADPNIADNTNYTPLMNAVSGEHEEVVKILLKHNADPNVQSGDNPEDEEWEPGRAALMDAAVSGNVSIARQLLKAGANPNQLNAKGRTALHSAVISANPDMVAFLLKEGSDPNIYGSDEEPMSALDLALRRWAGEDEDKREGGVTDVLRLMLEKGMPTDGGSLNETALDLVTQGRIEVIEMLGKHGFSVDVNYSRDGDNKLLRLAALGDLMLEEGSRLIDIGADVNCTNTLGLPVLSMAVRSGAKRFSKMLLKAGADVMKRNGNNVLAYDLAVIYGHDDITDLLIQHMNQVVSPVDKQAEDGTTALMQAAMTSDVKSVQELLSAGADASRRDRQGESPLSYAVANDLIEVVQVLRAAGAEKLPGDESISPQSIVHAGGQGALGTILDLLDAGVPIDYANANGNTALTEAKAHPGVIKALVRLGADLSHRNRDGKTAYMFAAAMSRTLVTRVLKDLGSPVDEPAELDGFAQVQALLKTLSAQVSSTDEEEADNESDVEEGGDALLMACLTGDALTVSRQIDAGADVNYENDEGLTPLEVAVAGLSREGLSRRRERDFEQIIDLLLSSGADPNRGRTSPLVLATVSSRLHIVNAMIRAGADIDAATELPTDEHGGSLLATALYAALMPLVEGYGVDERVSLAILEAGPDLLFRSNDGSMAIHCASQCGKTEVLGKILDLAPDLIDAADHDGLTPLMFAAARGQTNAISVLLQRGASRSLQDNEEKTAADIAQEAGHLQAATLLS